MFQIHRSTRLINEYRKNPALGTMEGAKSLDPNEVKKVADRLWQTPLEIDRYLAGRKDLPEEHRQIIAGWKHCVSGTFVVERHLKAGSVFIGSDSGEDKVYQVVGTISPLPEIFPPEIMPAITEATLIPFRDVIISDGLYMIYPVMSGSGMKKGFKDSYTKAKKENKIIRQL